MQCGARRADVPRQIKHFQQFESPHTACKRHEDSGPEKRAVAFELLRIWRKWGFGLQKCFSMCLWEENFSRALRLNTAIKEQNTNTKLLTE
jgi:hypothetical protein